MNRTIEITRPGRLQIELRMCLAGTKKDGVVLYLGKPDGHTADRFELQPGAYYVEAISHFTPWTRTSRIWIWIRNTWARLAYWYERLPS